MSLDYIMGFDEQAAAAAPHPHASPHGGSFWILSLPAAEAILWWRWWWWWCTGEGDVWQKDRQAVRFRILFGTRTRRDIIAWFLCPRLSRPFHVHLNHQLLLPWSKAEAGHRTRSFSGISHWIHASFPFLYLPISTSSCFRVESQWIWTFARSRRPDPTKWQAK